MLLQLWGKPNQGSCRRTRLVKSAEIRSIRRMKNSFRNFVSIDPTVFSTISKALRISLPPLIFRVSMRYALRRICKTVQRCQCQGHYGGREVSFWRYSFAQSTSNSGATGWERLQQAHSDMSNLRLEEWSIRSCLSSQLWRLESLLHLYFLIRTSIFGSISLFDQHALVGSLPQASWNLLILLRQLDNSTL